MADAATEDLIAWLNFHFPTVREAVLIVEMENGECWCYPIIRTEEGAPAPPAWSELPLLRDVVAELERRACEVPQGGWTPVEPTRRNGGN
jgi:hypothetical protein